MYFKSPDNRSKINVPIGYKGTAFSHPGHKPPDTTLKPSPAKIEKDIDLKEEIKPLSSEQRLTEETHDKESFDICEQRVVPNDKKNNTSSIFSSEGGLSAEELLILALALIVFQGGKENELALLLLALLFIK